MPVQATGVLAPREALREPVARALVNKGVRLGKLGRHDEAITVYEQVMSDYGHDTTPAIREVVEFAAEARRLVLRDDQA